MALPLRYNVQNLLARRTSSAMAALGSALTALLLTSLLAMDEGLKSSFSDMASPANVIFLHKGAPAEWSEITRDIPAIVSAYPEVATKDGRPRISTEYVNTIWLPRPDGSEALIQLRGVEPNVADVYDWFKLERGRMPAGTEILAGRSAAERMDLTIGSTLAFGRRNWKVVGIFSAGGTAAESEVWADMDDAMADFRKDKISAIVLRLKDPGSMNAFVRRVEQDRRLADYEGKPETEYYEEQTAFLGFMGAIAGLVGICMGIGAALGGMNVFFTAVAQRTSEIGMLRVIGFSKGAVLTSFLLEAFLVGLAGSLAGATLGLGANLLRADIWGSSFQFSVTPQIYVMAVVVGVLFAVVGGLFPAIRASRLQPVLALRRG